MPDLSDELNAFARAFRGPAPGPRPKPVDGRSYADGSGPRRRPWGRSGARGAYRLPSGRYAAVARVAGRAARLGTYPTAGEAGAAVARFLAECRQDSPPCPP